MSEQDFTPDEMMTIAASRVLKNEDVCFVGIGAPSAACNVAQPNKTPSTTTAGSGIPPRTKIKSPANRAPESSHQRDRSALMRLRNKRRRPNPAA